MATYNSDKWDEWMVAALRGDQNAYRLLLNDLRNWLMIYYAKRTHQSAIEDLVQETLMSLHAKRHTYDPSKPFGPWISAVARHRWIDHMRKTLKYVETEIDENILPQKDIRYECARHDVQTLLKLIPEQQAKVIEMVKLKDMTIAEVSEKTGHSASSVKVMVHRGLKKMMVEAQEVRDE